MDITVNAPPPLLVASLLTVLLLGIAHLFFLESGLGGVLLGRELKREEAYVIGTGCIIAGYTTWLLLVDTDMISKVQSFNALVVVALAAAVPTLGLRLLASLADPASKESPKKSKRVVSMFEKYSKEIENFNGDK